MVRIPRDFNRRRPTAGVISDRVRQEVRRSGTEAARAFEEIARGDLAQGKFNADLANFVGNRFMATVEETVNQVRPEEADQYAQEQLQNVPEEVRPLASQYITNRIAMNPQGNPVAEQSAGLRNELFASLNQLIDKSYSDGKNNESEDIVNLRATQLEMLLEGMEGYISPSEKKAFEQLTEKKFIEGKALNDVVSAVNLKGGQFDDTLIDEVLEERFPQVEQQLYLNDTLEVQESKDRSRELIQQRRDNINQFLEGNSDIRLSETDLNALVEDSGNKIAVRDAFLAYYAEDEIVPAEKFAEEFDLKGVDLKTYLDLVEDSDTFGPILRDLPDFGFSKQDTMKLYNDIILSEGKDVDSLVQKRRKIIRHRELSGISKPQEFKAKLRGLNSFEEKIKLAAKRKLLDE